LRREKKIQEKTEREVKEEEATLKDLNLAMREIKHDIEVIKENSEHEHELHHVKNDETKSQG